MFSDLTFHLETDKTRHLQLNQDDFSLSRPHWADSVIELPSCLCVCAIMLITTKNLLQQKREAGNPIINTWSKTTSAIFSAFKRPTGTCLQSTLWMIDKSYKCKQVLVGLLHTKKMAIVALLNVFRIGFPASLLCISPISPKGLFTYYVSKKWGVQTPLPPLVSQKNRNWLNPLPLLVRNHILTHSN